MVIATVVNDNNSADLFGQLLLEFLEACKVWLSVDICWLGRNKSQLSKINASADTDGNSLDSHGMNLVNRSLHVIVRFSVSDNDKDWCGVGAAERAHKNRVGDKRDTSAGQRVRAVVVFHVFDGLEEFWFFGGVDELNVVSIRVLKNVDMGFIGSDIEMSDDILEKVFGGVKVVGSN